MVDRILKKWPEIESVTPYADKPDFLRRKYGKWLRENGYVLKDWINGECICWTWESLIKAGICRLLVEKQQRKKERKLTKSI